MGAGLSVGQVVRSQGRTIGEGEFAFLTDLSWAIGERHVNSEFVTTRGERGRELAGPLVIALVVSLAANGPLNGQLRDEHGLQVLASISLDAMLSGPVRPGDTLWAESEIVGVRESSNELPHGVLEIRDRGKNQRGEVVVELVRALKFSRTM